MILSLESKHQLLQLDMSMPDQVKNAQQNLKESAWCTVAVVGRNDISIEGDLLKVVEWRRIIALSNDTRVGTSTNKFTCITTLFCVYHLHRL